MDGVSIIDYSNYKSYDGQFLIEAIEASLQNKLKKDLGQVFHVLDIS